MFKEHKYFFLYFISIFLTILLYFSGILENIIYNLRLLGYLGSFLLGFFYTTAFTVPFATASYVLLKANINPIIGGFLGGFGAMLIDIIIYKISELEIGKTLGFGKRKIKVKRIKNRFLLKISPFLAFLIIASPLPDELASILMGLEKYNFLRFALISFFANSFGIFFLLYFGLLF